MAIERPNKQTQSAPQVATLPDNYGEPLDLPRGWRGILIGDTGAGKTTQLAELALYIFATEGKPTILFTADKGGVSPMLPYISKTRGGDGDKDIIIPFVYDESIDIWIWLSHAMRGEVKLDGKWVNVVEKFGAGLVLFEGLTAFSKRLMIALAEHSANHPGQAVGGDSAWTFEARDGNEVLKLASNTMSHYGLAQLRIMQEVWGSNPGVPQLWTAILKRDTDTMYGGSVLAAESVGKAQGAAVPQWFDFVGRINAQPQAGGAPVHTLYLSTHLDKMAKNAKVIANARLPMLGEGVKVPAEFTPASIVNALLAIKLRRGAAASEVDTRIALIQGRKK